MPIRPELRNFYTGPAWEALSHWVRFVRAGGKCEGCGRPHGHPVHYLTDGRWFDSYRGICRARSGQDAPFPDLADIGLGRVKPLWLATAHLDHNPLNNDPANLRALCPICHLEHDRPFHRRQFRLTILMRYAIGDLFDGPYIRPVPALPASSQPIPVAPPVSLPVSPPRWHEQRSLDLPLPIPRDRSRPGEHKIIH